MKKSEGLYFGMAEDTKKPIFMSYDGVNRPNVLTVAEIGRGINFSHKSKMLREEINLKYK